MGARALELALTTVCPIICEKILLLVMFPDWFFNISLFLRMWLFEISSLRFTCCVWEEFWPSTTFQMLLANLLFAATLPGLLGGLNAKSEKFG